MIIKEFLSAIQQGHISYRKMGLCFNYRCFCLHYRLDSEVFLSGSKRLKELMKQFPKYTGNPSFPLVDADDFAHHRESRVDFYERGTPWGDIRAEFVEWALNELAQNEVSYMKS